MYFLLLSPVSLTLFPRPPAPEKRERPFVLLQTINRSTVSAFLAYAKKYGLFCGLKDFALIDVLVSWKL